MELLATWLPTFGVVFAIIDPFGYVPVFLSMTSQDSSEKRNWMLRRACMAAFLLLTLFTLVGTFILDFFGISLGALQISGGLVLLVIAFDMIRVLPINAKISLEEEKEGSRRDDISIVPLAIPMLSGPASIASVIVLASKANSGSDIVGVIISVIVTLLFTYLVLRSATRILRAVGLTGLHVMTRVMGLLLLAMAVQFIINGYQSI